MLFINWRALQILFGGALFIAALIWVYRSVRSTQALVRRSVRILTGFVVSILSPIYLLLCFGLLFSTLEGCETHGSPIYSPDGMRAARIENFDGGALGGNTGVRVYQWRGLNTATVFYGGWASVEQQDIHWLTNAALEVRYSDDSSEHSCESIRSVEVHCIARPPRPAYPNYDGGRGTKP